MAGEGGGVLMLGGGEVVEAGDGGDFVEIGGGEILEGVAVQLLAAPL